MPEQQPQVQPHELHVDSGWKQQAEREKEELAKKVGDAKQAPDSLSSPPSAGPSPRPTEAEKKNGHSRPLPSSFWFSSMSRRYSWRWAICRIRPAAGRPWILNWPACTLIC